MSLGLAPFLSCHCQSLASGLPQILVGLLQSLLAGVPNTHLSHFQSATDTLLLRAGLVTSLCCLTIAHGPPVCPWLPLLWHSQPFLLSSLQVASHSPQWPWALWLYHRVCLLFLNVPCPFSLWSFCSGCFDSLECTVRLPIWAAPTDLCRWSLLATFSLRAPSLLFPKPRLKARAPHFVLTRICPHLSYVTHHTLSFLFHCRSSRTGALSILGNLQ